MAPPDLTETPDITDRQVRKAIASATKGGPGWVSLLVMALGSGLIGGSVGVASADDLTALEAKVMALDEKLTELRIAIIRHAATHGEREDP